MEKTDTLETVIETSLPPGVIRDFPDGIIAGRRIIRPIGEGGEGYTLLVEGINGEPETLAAKITTIAASLSGGSEAEKEARILKGLDHEDIPKYFDDTKLPGRLHAIFREYVPGLSIREELDSRLENQRGFSEREVIDVLLGLTPQLIYAHDATQHPVLDQVIHRDIKPSNIILGEKARLVDYGIAKPTADTMTHAATARGTFGYMAPEQFARLEEVGPWTDVYGLAVTATEMILGKVPQNVEDSRWGKQVAPKLPESISPGLRTVLEKALQPDISQRYASASDFENAIRAVKLGEVVEPLSAEVVVGDEISDVQKEINRLKVDGSKLDMKGGAALGAIGGLFVSGIIQGAVEAVWAGEPISNSYMIGLYGTSITVGALWGPARRIYDKFRISELEKKLRVEALDSEVVVVDEVDSCGIQNVQRDIAKTEWARSTYATLAKIGMSLGAPLGAVITTIVGGDDIVKLPPRDMIAVLAVGTITGTIMGGGLTPGIPDLYNHFKRKRLEKKLELETSAALETKVESQEIQKIKRYIEITEMAGIEYASLAFTGIVTGGFLGHLFTTIEAASYLEKSSSEEMILAAGTAAGAAIVGTLATGLPWLYNRLKRKKLESGLAQVRELEAEQQVDKSPKVSGSELKGYEKNFYPRGPTSYKV